MKENIMKKYYNILKNLQRIYVK